ncbi:P-loop containing nucleoside triphosphate hydrolase protein [Peniophora sp. CONT]|nr:P-loop containing nucleoside triphosphate hydrolase protein [Peniophora sp. CONT]
MSDEKPRTATEDLAKQRVAHYDYYHDPRTFSYKLRKTIKPKEKKIKERKHALVVRRLIDERGKHTGTVIDIKSPALCEVLLEINAGVEGLELSRHEAVASTELMYYSHDGLIKRLAVERDKEPQDQTESLIVDIIAAIHVVEEDLAHTLLGITQLTSEGEITFDLLWALFKPNSLIYSYHSPTEQSRMLLVRRIEYGMHMDRTRYLKLSCDILHDDGNLFGFAREHLEITEYRGVRTITDLPTYPLQYHPNADAVYAQAIEMGKRYVQMPQHSYHEISGLAVREGGKFYTSGRVMISPSAFHRFQPNSSYNPSVRRALRKDDLTDDNYAICTPILLGFAFDRKSWGAFAMSRIKDVRWNDDAFGALVLGHKQKTLIHGLVRQHASKEGGFDDIIEGKGKGLIGLLAGTPGCGKTLTAEAVAEITHKPLYAVSAGELGTTPDYVEHKLTQVLELAQLWDAVLLLDEAEVFLQQRNATDINRNALVSIFLRQLEYYRGILILTTNMAEQVDRAFESRIHFSVYYPELGVAARKSIWMTFLNKISLDVSKEDLDRLSEHRINGRQIKNVVSSAQTISLANGSPRLKLEEVDVVLGVLHDWQSATQTPARAT